MAWEGWRPRRWAAASALPLAAVAGCAAPQMPSDIVRIGSDGTAAFRIETARSIESAAAQVRKCYRFPRVSHSGRQIVTRLRVRYAPDGTLAGIPTILSQSGVTPANRMYAEAMGQAAILSVIRCSPLNLPAELHARGWDEFDLTFSTSVAA